MFHEDLENTELFGRLSQTSKTALPDQINVGIDSTSKTVLGSFYAWRLCFVIDSVNRLV